MKTLPKNLTSVDGRGVVIVLELGGEWLAETPLTRPMPGAGRPTATRQALVAVPRRVVVQAESESPLSFAARVGEQLLAFAVRGASLGTVLIACNERLDDAAQRARAEMARAAASEMARSGGGRLKLSACDRNQGRSRIPLSSLVRELRAEWSNARVDVTLGFADGVVDGDRSRDRKLTSIGNFASSKPASRPKRRSRPRKNDARRVA